jgi:hypothetical protein
MQTETLQEYVTGGAYIVVNPGSGDTAWEKPVTYRKAHEVLADPLSVINIREEPA